MIPFRIVHLLILCASTLSAQTPIPPDHVSLRFSVIGWGVAIPELFYGKGSPSQQLTVAPSTPSASQTYTGSTTLRFFVKSSQPEPLANKKQPSLREVASVQLPVDQDQVFILLAPGQDGRYSALIINGDTAQFPIGRLKAINLTNVQLALRLNREPNPVVILPGQDVTLNPDANNILVVEAAQNKTSAGWKRLYSTVIKVSPEKQTILLFASGKSAAFKESGGTITNEIERVMLEISPPSARPPAPLP